MLRESQSSLFERALLLATEDPEVTNTIQAYDFVTKNLSLNVEQRPALRRVKAQLVKKLQHKIEVLS